MTKKEAKEHRSLSARRAALAGKQNMTPTKKKRLSRQRRKHMKGYWSGLSEAKRDQHIAQLKRSKRKFKKRLQEADVIAIRKAFATGTFQKDIAARYGISIQQVSYIVNFRCWKNVGTAASK